MKRRINEGFLSSLKVLVVLVAVLFIAIQGTLANNNIVTKLLSQVDRLIHSDSSRSIQQSGTVILSPEGQVVSGSVSYGSFDLYSITMPPYSTLILSFKLPSSSSSVTVYAKEGSMPTPYHYDYKIASQYSSQTIDNSTLPIYITVYGESTNTNDYVLTASVTSILPNWIIGVIVASVIIGLLILVASFLIPVLICLGVCGCVCCAAASANRPITTTENPVNYYQQTPTYQKLE
ncbi:predicted protein [Naegleria gruberi]|uniref:Predicted protein n=1 Tax=Naegleria gruberi TaxID=5762 RepID=D2W0C1_NAEGR|nr:uncharacterized protein NAEGRDRAFT_74806 [Naegleria gruberi]EFC37447.1 predicted protein [Naegleria gruberi]|eukprot:XP_002670191.1 predicted protein [Naegleria gruberi strain NEG-M]